VEYIIIHWIKRKLKYFNVKFNYFLRFRLVLFSFPSIPFAAVSSVFSHHTSLLHSFLFAFKNAIPSWLSICNTKLHITNACENKITFWIVTVWYRTCFWWSTQFLSFVKQSALVIHFQETVKSYSTAEVSKADCIFWNQFGGKSAGRIIQFIGNRFLSLSTVLCNMSGKFFTWADFKRSKERSSETPSVLKLEHRYEEIIFWIKILDIFSDKQ